MDRNSSTSTDPPKPRCGCPSRMAVSSSADSACMIEKPVTCRPSPEPGPTQAASASGAPRSTIASPALPAQAIQASMPACACSGLPLAAICSLAVTGALYRTMNFVIMLPPALVHPETRRPYHRLTPNRREGFAVGSPLQGQRLRCAFGDEAQVIAAGLAVERAHTFGQQPRHDRHAADRYRPRGGQAAGQFGEQPTGLADPRVAERDA